MKDRTAACNLVVAERGGVGGDFFWYAKPFCESERDREREVQQGSSELGTGGASDRQEGGLAGGRTRRERLQREREREREKE